MSPEFTVRAAKPSDWQAIAALHVAASAAAYTHILDAHYLSVTIRDEKPRLWHERLVTDFDPAARKIMVAKAGGTLAGFACLLLDQEPGWGVYLHNLYTDAAFRGQRVASTVLAAALRALSETERSRPLHLKALALNAPARAIYDRWGGQVVEALKQDFPGSPAVDVVRYQWPSAAIVLARLAA